jgi:hypothetical protein
MIFLDGDESAFSFLDLVSGSSSCTFLNGFGLIGSRARLRGCTAAWLGGGAL